MKIESPSPGPEGPAPALAERAIPIARPGGPGSGDRARPVFPLSHNNLVDDQRREMWFRDQATQFLPPVERMNISASH